MNAYLKIRKAIHNFFHNAWLWFHGFKHFDDAAADAILIDFVDQINGEGDFHYVSADHFCMMRLVREARLKGKKFSIVVYPDGYTDGVMFGEIIRESWERYGRPIDFYDLEGK